MYTILFENKGAHDNAIRCCAWASLPDGSERIITGSCDETIKVWHPNGDEWELQGYITGQYRGVMALAVSPDRTTFASSSCTTIIWIWRLKDCSLLRTINTTPLETLSLDYSPDGRVLICGGQRSNCILVYDIETGLCIRKISPAYSERNNACVSVKFSPDNSFIACGDLLGNIKLYPVDEGTIVHLQKLEWAVNSIAFSPDAKLLYTTISNGHIRIYDAKQAKEVGTLSGHAEVVTSMSYSQDGRLICSRSEDCSVRIWDVQTRQCVGTLLIRDYVYDVALSPDSTRILIVSDTFQIYKTGVL